MKCVASSEGNMLKLPLRLLLSSTNWEHFELHAAHTHADCSGRFCCDVFGDVQEWYWCAGGSLGRRQISYQLHAVVGVSIRLGLRSAEWEGAVRPLSCIVA